MNREAIKQRSLDLMEKRLFQTCGYCGHTGADVNHVNYRHIGGQGEVPFPVCDDAEACAERSENKNRKEIIMVVSQSTDTKEERRNQMATLITWDNEAPATPELLDPLFDNMGLGKEDDSRPENPEQKELAREAAKNYFTNMIKERGNGTLLTMGEVNKMGYVFYDAYLAGLTGTINPQRS